MRTDIKDAIRRHVEHGIPTGGFLQAVLENDLKESMSRADDENRRDLFDIVSFCYNEIPSECWGSPAKVAAWRKAKADERERAKATAATACDSTTTPPRGDDGLVAHPGRG